MSGFSTPRGGVAPAQPKQISNRLLNMKFMQRAAATTVQKSPHQASTPLGEPQLKRRRTGDFATGQSNPSTPASASTPSYNDRMGLFETNTTPNTRGANNYSLDNIETEWVLNVQILPVNGHAAAINDTGPDSADEGEYDVAGSAEDDIWDPSTPSGRQAYGSFKRKKIKVTSATATPASESKYEKKRGRDYVDDEDEISEISNDDSDLEDGEASEQEKVPSSTKVKNKKGGLDFKSETALRKMDSLDFQRPGFDHGFGRQRQGLAGDGRGFGSPAAGRGKSKKKARKSR